MRKKVTNFILHTIDLREGTDIRGTIDSIRNNIGIKGYNVWILAAAAVIASIGLDTNSQAVIIGAMLISPLMSPILGVGLSIGINDRETLINSMENLSVAVVASIGMSTLYFLITPLGTPTEQILARTQPTLLDVGIAFFGGVAGIVSGSRKEKTNAIPGVAIATALMPPLCVTGYGLVYLIRTGEWDIFLGAFYLFFLNAVFITLSTYLIVRFLNFPYKDFIDDAAKKKMTTWMTVFVLLLIVPSGFLFYEVIHDIRFNRDVNEFIQTRINDNEHQALDYKILDGDPDTLRVVIDGRTYIDSAKQAMLGQEFMKIRPSVLQLVQLNAENVDFDQVTNVFESRLQKQVVQVMSVKNQEIDEKDQQLQYMVSQFDSLKANAFGIARVQKELKVLYPQLETLSFSMAFETNFERQDTLPMCLLKWKRGQLTRTTRNRNAQQIGAFLRVRLELDTIKVTEY